MDSEQRERLMDAAKHLEMAQDFLKQALETFNDVREAATLMYQAQVEMVNALSVTTQLTTTM